MKRAIWLTIFGVLAFLAILVARLPASWVVPSGRSDFVCADVEGTVWQGNCTGLSVQHQPVGDLSWDVQAARLLAGKLAANVILTRPGGYVRGNFELGLDKSIAGRNVQLSLPLDPRLMPQLPPGISGSLEAELSTVHLVQNRIRGLAGEIRARDLRMGAGSAAEPFGSYALKFPREPGGGGDPLGQLRDLGGPLEVQGTVRLTGEPGFELEALLKARPDAPRELVQDLQFLGSPDAQGRRPFSLAGSF